MCEPHTAEDPFWSQNSDSKAAAAGRENGIRGRNQHTLAAFVARHAGDLQEKRENSGTAWMGVPINVSARAHSVDHITHAWYIFRV